MPFDTAPAAPAALTATNSITIRALTECSACDGEGCDACPGECCSYLCRQGAVELLCAVRDDGASCKTLNCSGHRERAVANTQEWLGENVAPVIGACIASDIAAQEAA